MGKSISGHFTTTEEFEIGDFTLKTHQMFSVHTGPKEFENVTITGRFLFVFQQQQQQILFPHLEITVDWRKDE